MPSLQLSNQELIEIYERHVNTVYYVCYSFMKNKPEAEDMVQETFLRLITSTPCFQNQRHEKAWLIVTASNLCRDTLKKWWRRTENIEDLKELGAADSLENPVLDAILALPKAQRVPVYMFYYEGYTSAEIGAYLGIPAATVRTRLARAKQKMRHILGGDL